MKFTTHFALQSQEARLFEGTPYAADSERQTGFSPSMIPCSKGLTPRPHAGRYLFRLQRTRPIRVCAFQAELFPLHSPLLRESLLVSFPPLSYMLKFSGSSCVTETQEMSVSSYGDGVPRLRRASGLVLSAASPRSLRSANL